MERTRTGEFNWVDLSARDMQAQTAFCEALFGWTYMVIWSVLTDPAGAAFALVGDPRSAPPA
jgi:predicted enzyme related to lactoylglutathione lyase